MRVYLLVMLIAGTVTYLTTPFARWLACRTKAVTPVRARDVHTRPTPRMGGVAMFLGLAVVAVFGHNMPFLQDMATTKELGSVVISAALVCALGMADDMWDLDWLTKLSGQVLAAALLAWQGVQLVTLPIFGVTITSPRTSLFITILVVVGAINAINFVDGLDGLAAGMVAISGMAFFVYAYQLTRTANPTEYASFATFLMAAMVGVCLGFLPHNFFPARVFMGDSGSMVLGLIIAAATISVTGQINPGAVGVGGDGTLITTRQVFPAFLPILLPVAVLALPLADMLMAVTRRLRAGQSPFKADRMHLHHRLLALGHSQRRAVAIMYVWTAVFGFSAAALVAFSSTQVLVAMGIGVAVALVLTLGPLRGPGRKDARRRRRAKAAASRRAARQAPGGPSSAAAASAASDEVAPTSADRPTAKGQVQ